MIARLRRVFRQAPILASAFAVALLLTGWFGAQTVMRAVYWSDPRHQNQEIEGWMTIGYVGRSWQVPREALIAALQDVLPGDAPGRRLPIERLAQESGLPEDDITALLYAAIAAYQTTAPDQQ